MFIISFSLMTEATEHLFIYYLPSLKLFGGVSFQEFAPFVRVNCIFVVCLEVFFFILDIILYHIYLFSVFSPLL